MENQNKVLSSALSKYSQEGADFLLRKTTCLNYHMGCVLEDCNKCTKKNYIGSVKRKDDKNADKSNARYK